MHGMNNMTVQDVFTSQIRQLALNFEKEENVFVVSCTCRVGNATARDLWCSVAGNT
jgi:hypothetical protein